MHITLTENEFTTIRENIVKQFKLQGHTEEKHTINLTCDNPLAVIEIGFGILSFTCLFKFLPNGTTVEKIAIFHGGYAGLAHAEVKNHPNDTREALIERWSTYTYPHWFTPLQVEVFHKHYYEHQKGKNFVVQDDREYMEITNKLTAKKWRVMTPPNDLVLIKTETNLNISPSNKQKICNQFVRYIQKHRLSLSQCNISFDTEAGKQLGTSVIYYKLEDIRMVIVFSEFVEHHVKYYNMTLLFTPTREGMPSCCFMKELNLKLKYNQIFNLFSSNCPLGTDINPLA